MVDGRSSDGLGTDEIVTNFFLHLFKGRFGDLMYKKLTLTVGPFAVYLSQGSPRSTPCLGRLGVHQPPQEPGLKPPPRARTGCAT